MEGEDIELIEPPCSSETPEFHSYSTQQVSETKRRKVEKGKLFCKAMTTEEMCQVSDIFNLSTEKKQELYCYWKNQLRQNDSLVMKKSMDDYEEWCKRHWNSRRDIDIEVLLGTDVIGMTTTGAAKHHHILQKIHPKIVIFEEAAEIFESHIITSLPPSVHQLILIGDHQQLRPKPNCYELEVKYDFGVSLFE